MKAKVYQFKIMLIDIEPVIWRRFKVISDITFRELHEVIQTVMGWTNTHLYNFEIGKIRIECPEDEEDIMPSQYENQRAVETKLDEILKDKEGTVLEYIYDYGGGWEHLIKLEKVIEKEEGKEYPRCIEGAMNCPPEDCGGASGYRELLKALKNPDHEEHQSKQEWLGAHFDPERFEVEKINEALESE